MMTWKQVWKWAVICSLPLIMALPLTWGKPYQEYRKDRCEWSTEHEQEGLQVHHYFSQTKFKAWKNVEINLVTLCRRCHLVFHKGDFDNVVPETCVLFGKTVKQIMDQCEKETGVKYDYPIKE